MHEEQLLALLGALITNRDNTNLLIKTGIDYLNLLCKPAAEEIGLLIKGTFSLWRIKNLHAILEKAKVLLESVGEIESLRAPTRIVMKVVKEGSYVEDDEVQTMWAGLLASSCARDAKDDSNLIFINILSQMTTPEARIVNLALAEGVYRLYRDHERHYTMIELETSILLERAELPNSGMLFCVLEHLGSLGLLNHQIRSDPEHEFVRIRFEDSALQLYVRCQGFSGSLDEFIASHPPLK